MNAMIVFRISKEQIGIDIRSVREVTEVSEVVRVPRVSDFILGLINIRGDVIPVISLKRRLGLKEDEVGKALLIIEHDGRIVGLKVDELYGTRAVDETCINRRAELLATRKEKEFFLGVFEEDKGPILVLNLKKILSKEDQ